MDPVSAGVLMRLALMPIGGAGDDRYWPPLRILRVLLVPERVASMHNGYLLEIVVRRRRRDRPFQRAPIPRVMAGCLPASQAVDEIDYENENGSRDCEGPDRRKQVPEVPSLALRIGRDATGHAEKPGDVHRKERQVEADEHQPEMYLSQPIVQELAGQLRHPAVEAGEQSEDRAAEEDVVEMRHDAILARLLVIRRHDRMRHAAQPADREHGDEA